MDENAGVELNLIEVIKRRIPIGASVLLALLLTTLALALGLPSIYKSRAVILIEQKEVPEDLVRSLVTSFADQRIQTISQRVLTNGHLGSIIEKFELYKDLRKTKALEDVLERMRSDISIQPISADVVDPRTGRAQSATIAFELSYENRSAELSQKVANELVSLFLNENLKERNATATGTLAFLTTESDRLRDEVAALEQKLGAFKEKNVNQLPELQSVNLELMNATQREISELNGRIESAREQQVYLEAQLAQQKPSIALTSDTGERILGPEDRLKVLESQFISLSSKYGSSHPDVVAMKKEMDSLRAQTSKGTTSSRLQSKLTELQTELASDEKKYSADHPDIKRLKKEISAVQLQITNSDSGGVAPGAWDTPDNPAYIELAARLKAAEGDLRSLEQQRADLKVRLKDLQARFVATPRVEKEFKALEREYETVQAKYREVVAKKHEAELATNLETNQKGERFELIEPPVLPERPAKPNRLIIGVLGVVLSLGGGVGVGALAETLDARIYGRSGVVRTLGVAPLAVIPAIENDETKSARRRRGLVALLVAFLIPIVLAALIHVFVSPLDVLYFRVLRTMGL